MINAPIVSVVGVILYLYARRYGGSQLPLWAAWRDPPAWARAAFGAKGGQILVNDLLIELVGLVWLATGLALIVLDVQPGSAGFNAASGIVYLALIIGGMAAIAIWTSRQIRHRP